MNEAEKERLIKKDIVSIENRVRHAFNQGYEMGMKESSSEIPNTCGDAISRQAVLDIITFEDKWLFDAYGHNANTRIAFSGLKSRVKALSSVTPQPRIGQWIYDKVDMNGYYLDNYECSVCKCSKTVDTPYCPMCGAKMEVQE